jgi:hypothetical protein
VSSGDTSQMFSDIGAAFGRLAASGWLDRLDELLDGLEEDRPQLHYKKPPPLPHRDVPMPAQRPKSCDIDSPEAHYERAKSAFDQVEHKYKTLSGIRTSELQREGIGEACLGILSALIGGKPE